jgi:hypothetical protein
VRISTLCRVGSVLDLGKFYVELFNAAPAEERGATDVPAEGSATFVSQEDYFPVFQSNSRDLQLLEASVVTYITAFSTFMKAARDAQRHLAQTPLELEVGEGDHSAGCGPVGIVPAQDDRSGKTWRIPSGRPWHAVRHSVIRRHASWHPVFQCARKTKSKRPRSSAG